MTIIDMVNTKTASKPSPFANALALQEAGSRTDEDQQLPYADENDLFRKALARTGDNPDGTPSSIQMAEEQPLTEEELENRRLNIERSREINPVEENVVDVFARQQAKDTQELNELQRQFVAMAAQKQMPKAERPEILEARVVDPGERQYVFANLIKAAKQKIEMFVPQPPHVIAKGRQSRREGLVTSAEQDREEQMKLHHEQNVNGGA